MSCNNPQTYDYSTVYDHTVFRKSFTIDEAQANWDLKMEVFDATGVKVKTVPLVRENATTWNIAEYKEDLTPSTYRYTLCYLIGELERVILTGKITVKHALKKWN